MMSLRQSFCTQTSYPWVCRYGPIHMCTPSLDPSLDPKPSQLSAPCAERGALGNRVQDATAKVGHRGTWGALTRVIHGSMRGEQAHWCHGTATSALVPWHIHKRTGAMAQPSPCFHDESKVHSTPITPCSPASEPGGPPLAHSRLRGGANSPLHAPTCPCIPPCMPPCMPPAPPQVPKLLRGSRNPQHCRQHFRHVACQHHHLRGMWVCPTGQTYCCVALWQACCPPKVAAGRCGKPFV